MHDGDLYVNDGETYDNGVYYPGVPEERTTAEREEAAARSSSFPIMAEVADWFEREVQACNDIHNIQVASLTVNGTKYSREVSVEAQVLAYQLLKEKLQEKAREFADYKESQDA